jgi:putative zinc finger protein
MLHLDEGTLHALLDGELDVAEASEAQRHLSTCVACGARLQEVKQFLAEANNLVGALEMPAGAAAPPPSRARQSPPYSRPPREPESWNEVPVLLLPDNAEALARRRRWLGTLRWVAIIAVVVGGSRLLLSVVRPGSSLPPARDITTASPAVPPAVASREELRRPDPRPVASAPSRPTRVQEQNRAPASKSVQRTKVAAAAPLVDSALELADSVAAFDDSASAEGEKLAVGNAADESTSTQSVSRDSEPKDAPLQEDELDTRRAAAEALAELDRQRIRQRAAAATAALPPPAPARSEAAPAAEQPPPPPPRTPEQRAQVYLRIGLDEAVKQLGRPVHVIEGMTPEFIGLTYGRLVPGADANRPVVRVVYVDSRGRMILLDQQRMRTGQAPGGAEGNLRWSVGDVMLYLRGEPGPDVLRNLQRRVR